MAILGSATTVAAKVGRTKANALTVEFKDGAGKEFGKAKQKGSAGVLFGFRNGGKSSYTLTAGSDELAVDVASTTTISRGGTAIGKIVPADGACRIEDGAGTVLAVVRPFAGLKADDPWVHPLLTPQGSEFGTLDLLRSHTSWGDVVDDIINWDLELTGQALKVPTSGAMLKLAAPVHDVLGDLLVAACVDFTVLPRGYIAPR